MKVNGALLSVSIGALAGALAMLDFPAEAREAAKNDILILQGRCFYADRYAPLLAQNHVFADCDSVEVEETGSVVTFSFRHSRRTRAMEFRTTYNGETWDISAVRFFQGGWKEVSGECTVLHQNGAISTLTCITSRGARIYVANLEVSAD